jgi:GTPase SAR1 family protein
LFDFFSIRRKKKKVFCILKAQRLTMEPKDKKFQLADRLQELELQFLDDQILREEFQELEEFQIFQIDRDFLEFYEFEINEKLQTLLAMENLKVPWKHTKLFLLGDSGAGKTSTLRWLKGDKFESKHITTDLVEREVVDRQKWKNVIISPNDLIADGVVEQKNFVNTQMNPSSPNVVSSNNAAESLEESNEKIKQLEIDHNTIQDVRDKIKEYRKKQLPTTFDVWDFGGQDVYYNTHHFFLSSKAVYLLVFNISELLKQTKKEDQLNRIKFWLNSIRFYASSAPLVVIGTHMDLVDDQQGLMKDLFKRIVEEICKHFDNFKPDHHLFAINCKSSDYQHDIQKLLLALAEELLVGEQYPLRYMLLLDKMLKDTEKKSDLSRMDLATVNKIADQFGIRKEEVDPALRLFHDGGFLLYYPDDAKLKDLAFLQPRELIDAFRAVIIETEPANAEENFFRCGDHPVLHLSEADRLCYGEGKLSPKILDKLWEKYEAEERILLRSLFQQFGLGILDPKESGDLIVPCIIEDGISPNLEGKFENPITFTCNCDPVPPLGFSSRISVRMMSHYDNCIPFRHGCVFETNGTWIWLLMETGEVKARVQGPEENIDVLVALHNEIYKAMNEKGVSKITTSMMCIDCKEKKLLLKESGWTWNDFYCKQCKLSKKVKKRQTPHKHGK